MKPHLVFFGKASSFAEAECKKYLKRCPDFKVTELKESKKSNAQQNLKEEWKLLLKLVGSKPLVALAEEGKCLASVPLSKKLHKSFQGEVYFVIGSAYGLSPECKKHASFLMSLSPLTLTHDHARVLLVEQLYRARCIEQNHPYHHV